MREYCLRGGFLLVDDFRGPDFYNFSGARQARLSRSTSSRSWTPRTDLHCFFSIKSLDLRPSTAGTAAGSAEVLRPRRPSGAPPDGRQLTTTTERLLQFSDNPFRRSRRRTRPTSSA